MSARTLLLTVTAPVAALLILTGGLTVALGGGAAACTSRPGSSEQTTPITDPTFDREQTANATAIVATASALGVPVRGWIIAVAVAIQESSLRNLRHGDAAGPDSLGLFQQRHAWGKQTARLDPTQTTRMFLTGGARGQDGLLDIHGWQTMPLTDAAQAVQRSAHPTAYAEHEAEATRLVTSISAASATGIGGFSCDEPPGPPAAQAVAFARQQIGIPYRWGGDGPSEGGFDCSGLTHAAYAAAGIDLPRTAQTQYDAAPRLPSGVTLVPGDLVFFGDSAGNVTHVGMYVGDGQMIDAPRAGTFVRIESYRRSNYLGATRPSERLADSARGHSGSTARR